MNPPIPLQFEDYTNILLNKITKASIYQVVYLGYRPLTSYEIHKMFSGGGNYEIKFGGIFFDEKVLQKFNIKIIQSQQRKKSKRNFVGMNPSCINQ